MKLSQKDKKVEQMNQHGRVIARAMDELNVQKEKNMAKAEKRRATMLENAAEKELFGNN